MHDTLILDEVRRLQQQVAALQASAARRHRVTLTPIHPQPWLGQAVTLSARVTDEGGTQTRVDLPVLLTTTWGQLRAADGYTLQTGESIVAHTDLTGTLIVTLLPPLVAELGEPQQRALETLLVQFDPTAPTPSAMLPLLNAAVAQYQQPTAQDLRAAVDFYVQQFYQPRLATLAANDWLQSWQTTTATVLALAPETSVPLGELTGVTLPLLAATIQGAAVLPLHFRDWLGPWLQCYTNVADTEASLRQQFTLLKELTQDADELVAATTNLVQTVVRQQSGRTGEWIKQQVVAGVVNTLLEQETQELPLPTRVKLITGVPAAAETIRTLGGRAGASLTQSTVELRQTLTQQVDNKVGQIQSALTTRLGSVEGNVDGLQAAVQTKADRTDLTTLQGQLVEVGKGTQTLTTRFDGLQTDLAKLSERTTAVQTQFGKLQNDIGRFDTSLNHLQLDLRDVQEELKRRPGFQVIQDLQVTLATLSNTVTTLNTDVTTFRDQIAGRLADTVTHTELGQVRTELGDALAAKIDQQQLAQSLGDLDARFRTLQTDIGTFRSNFTRLRGDLDTLGTNVLKLRVDVDRLRP